NRTAITSSPKASTPGPATPPAVGPCSCAIKCRPNATTAAPSRNSKGSKPCAPPPVGQASRPVLLHLKYQTDPFGKPNGNKTNHLTFLETNPLHGANPDWHRLSRASKRSRKP